MANPVPAMKPRWRPTRRMSSEAGIVPRAVPTTAAVAGRVASALSAASPCPARLPTVAISDAVLMGRLTEGEEEDVRRLGLHDARPIVVSLEPRKGSRRSAGRWKVGRIRSRRTCFRGQDLPSLAQDLVGPLGQEHECGRGREGRVLPGEIRVQDPTGP